MTTGNDERQLLRRYAESRSPGLREQLVARFLPLARSLAGRYRGSAEPFEDLVQVASVGLLQAIDRYDPERGRPFIAYAVPTILGELRRHFRDHTASLHVPRGAQELIMRVERAVDELADENGRSPTLTEIAARLGVDEEQVLEARRADRARRTISLDAPRPHLEGEPGPLIDVVADTEPGFDRVEAAAAAAAADLDERERRVLELRFGEGLGQYEIGRRLGVSQMQISRVMRRALHKLLEAVRGGEELSP